MTSNSPAYTNARRIAPCVHRGAVCRRPENERRDRVTILKIVLAIFLPPVAAFLQVGVGLHFWLNILLTILGILPGQIHAIWLIVAEK